LVKDEKMRRGGMGEESKESHDDVTKSKYLTRDHIEKKYGQKNGPKWENGNFIYVPVRK
jgi:hypothetical protein